MSKRARITLQPIDEPEAAKPSEGPTAVQATPSRAETRPTDAPKPEPATAEAANWRPARGTIITAVLAGLAIAAVVLLIRRRPF